MIVPSPLPAAAAAAAAAAVTTEHLSYKTQGKRNSELSPAYVASYIKPLYMHSLE